MAITSITDTIVGLGVITIRVNITRPQNLTEEEFEEFINSLENVKIRIVSPSNKKQVVDAKHIDRENKRVYFDVNIDEVGTQRFRLKYIWDNGEKQIISPDEFTVYAKGELF